MPVGLPLLDRAVWSEPREPIHRRDTLGKQGSGCLSCAWDPHTASRSQGNCSDSNVLRDSRHASGRGWHLNFETNLRSSSQARPHVGGETRTAAVDRMFLRSDETGGQVAVKLQHAPAACRTAVDMDENIHGRKTSTAACAGLWVEQWAPGSVGTNTQTEHSGA